MLPTNGIRYRMQSACAERPLVCRRMDHHSCPFLVSLIRAVTILGVRTLVKINYITILSTCQSYWDIHVCTHTNDSLLDYDWDWVLIDKAGLFIDHVCYYIVAYIVSYSVSCIVP